MGKNKKKENLKRKSQNQNNTLYYTYINNDTIVRT